MPGTKAAAEARLARTEAGMEVPAILMGGRPGDGHWGDEGDEELGVSAAVRSVRWRGLGYVLLRCIWSGASDT